MYWAANLAILLANNLNFYRRLKENVCRIKKVFIFASRIKEKKY
jgi:hypothetical protein